MRLAYASRGEGLLLPCRYSPAESMKGSVRFKMENFTKKRVGSILLTGAMLAGMLPTSVLAAAPTNFNYQSTEYENQVPGLMKKWIQTAI